MGNVHFTKNDHIAVITLDTPGRLNAFTRQMRAEIARLLRQDCADSSVRAAIITGAGEAFCAGQDFTESSTWDDTIPWVEEFEEFARAILSFPKPLVAAVNGSAAGGGFQMAVMCDSRVGHSGTIMGQPEVKTGLASVAGTWLLQRSVGDLRARELVLTGRLMAAEELKAVGLLDEVVERSDLMGAAIRRCRVFAANPSDSFARTKTWLYENISDELAAVFADGVRVHRAGFASGVSQKGAADFLAHRRAGGSSKMNFHRP